MLRVSSPIEFGQLFLGRVVGEFMRRYPAIQVEVELTTRTIDPVEEGIDVVIHRGRLQDSSLVARPMMTSPRQLFASPDYIAQYGMPKRPEELSQHRCINTLMDGGRKWHLLCRVLEHVVLPSTELYALYPSRRFQAMKVKAFIDFMIESLEKYLSSEVEAGAEPLILSAAEEADLPG